MKRKTGKKASKKWWIWLIVVILIIGSCSNDDPQDTHASDETSIPEVSSTTLPTIATQTDTRSIFDRFIDLYGRDRITNIKKLDINGNDYRTEYRLDAFKRAIGQKGNIDCGTIEILNYGVWTNDSIRFYATVDTLENAKALCTDIIHILDSSISDEDISSEFSPLDTVSSANIYLGSTGYISGYIHTNYANGGVSGYDVMIDCSKINF